MSIPENWEEELMLHSWKMMKLDRYKRGPDSDSKTYYFPNGITVLTVSVVNVNIEFENIVEQLLEGWKFEKKMDKKKSNVQFWLSYKNQAGDFKMRGEFEDLWWDLYSLDI